MPDDPLLSRLDLNLLVALDALLTERNVTRAAERLRLSQPSLSAALARLRVHFDDPLLARRGNTYELTPLAARLPEHTADALNAVRRVFESQSRWDPSESSRTFTVHGSDYALTVVGPAVSRLASAQAPGVRVRFVPTSSMGIDDVLNRLASLDALILPHGIAADRPCMDLWRDDWVVLAAADNPRVHPTLSLETLSASPWVFTYQTRVSFTAVGRQLEQLGLQPRIEAIVESFSLLPLYVAGTDRLALIQRKLAPRVQGLGGVAVCELPFEPVPLIEALWWHPAHENDPEHEWLRGLFTEAVRDLA
ncbi:LysR family transcriptional regulator [Microbacterium lushaniae]|nr:LysR family transcriptional regulator [Microbacterium lushaniae]KAA9156098.1 LysR family transcriptional regulator [Microbacterium lushaniae]